MSDLQDQLRGYLLSVSPPRFELDEIVARASEGRAASSFDQRPGGRFRRPWVAALAAGAAVLVVIGGAALLASRVITPVDPELTPVISVADLATSTTADAALTTPTTGANDEAVVEGITAIAPMVWTRIADPSLSGGDGPQSMMDVAVGGGVAVAVGFDSSGGDDDAAVWYTLDGVTWSRVAHDEAVFGGVGYQRMLGVAASESGFVAVGFEGDAADSSDTNSVTFQSSESHAAVWRSDDGINWTRVPHAAAFSAGGGRLVMTDVTFSDSRFVAVGNAYQQTEPFAIARWDTLDDVVNPAIPIDVDIDAAVWTSVDGVTWNRVQADDEVFGGDTIRQSMNAITAGGPGFVAVGQEGFEFLGVDDWTPLPLNNPDGDEHLTDNVAAVWTSPDAETWTRVENGPALVHNGGLVVGWATMFDVTANGPGLVAVGRDVWGSDFSGPPFQFNERAAVWLSDDGINWRRAHPTVGDGPDMEAVIATTEGDLVAGGGMDLYWSAGVWTSQDGGNTWTQHPHEDTLFGGIPASRSDAETFGSASIQGLATFNTTVFAVGTFDADAAVWVGTWTGADG